MRRIGGRVAVALCLCLGLAGSAWAQEASGKPWSLKSVLKQMDKATKGLERIAGEVHWDEKASDRQFSGGGKIYVDFRGNIRAEVEGSTPRTFLALLPRIYVYWPYEKTVDSYYVPDHPDLLSQYALVGFYPTGSMLKQDYKITLVSQGMLEDGREAVRLELLPRSREAQAAILPLALWVETANWLPAQMEIRHKTAPVHVKLSFTGLVRDELLTNETFEPRWPDGTTVTRK